MKYYFQCPACGKSDQFFKPFEESPRLGGDLVLSGNLYGAARVANYMRSRVQCGDCSYIFAQPPIPTSAVSRGTVWLLGVLFLPAVAAILFVTLADGASVIPAVPGIDLLEEMVAAQPRTVAWILVWLLGSSLVFCWLASWVSNAKFQKELATRFRLYPLAAKENARRQGLRPDNHVKNPPLS